MTDNIETHEEVPQEIEIKDGDFVIDLATVIPTSDQLSKYAEVVIDNPELIKGFSMEDVDDLKSKYELNCKLVGINNPEGLLDALIVANIFYTIVYEGVEDIE